MLTLSLDATFFLESFEIYECQHLSASKKLYRCTGVITRYPYTDACIYSMTGNSLKKNFLEN